MRIPMPPAPVPDPLVRAAGYTLLVYSAAWLLLLLAIVGYGTGSGLLVAVIVPAGCAVGVLRGSRVLTLLAIVVLALVSLRSVALILVNAPLIVLLVLAYQQLDRLQGPARPRFRPGHELGWGWPRPPTVPVTALAGVGAVLVSVTGAAWTVSATMPTPLPGSVSMWVAGLLVGSGPITVALLLIAPAVVLANAGGWLRDSPGWAVASTAQIAVLAALVSYTAERATHWSTFGWALVDVLLLLAAVSSYTRLHVEHH